MYSKQQWPLYRKLTSYKPTKFLPEDLAIPDTQTNNETLTDSYMFCFVLFFCLLGPSKASYSEIVIKVSLNFIGIFRPRCDLDVQFSELYS